MKNIIFILLSVIISNHILAQNPRYSSGSKPPASVNVPKVKLKPLSPLFVKLSVGYSFLTPGAYSGAAKGIADLKGQALAAGTTINTSNPLGSGVRACFGLGYHINDNLSFGIDAEGLFGASMKERQVIATRGLDVTSEHTLRIMMVVPHILFKTITTEGFYLYNRVGIVVGLPLSYSLVEKGRGEISLTSGGPLVVGDYSRNSSINNRPGLGFMATLGANFKLNRHVSVFAELYTSQFTTIPSQIKTNSFTFNGISQPLSETDYQPRIFVNSIGVSFGTQYRF